MWRGFQHDFISVSFLYAVSEKNGALPPAPRKRVGSTFTAFSELCTKRKTAQIICAAPTAGRGVKK